jgi:4-hydroxy-2-oxoheptanedioate aldolase
MAFPLHLESTHRRSKVLEKVRNGQVARFCNIGHYMPFAISWAAKHGFDGIWLDLEHRAMDATSSQAMLAQAVAADIDVMVRCPYRTERSLLTRYFEDGAAGLMFPLTDTREMAEHVVKSVKFPPIGNRGHDGAEAEANFGTAVWGGDKTNVATYIADANRETFIVVQIETPEAVANLEAIISTPGIDGVFVGPGDLGLRLDIQNQSKPASEHMQVQDVVEMVAAFCKKHNKAWGIPCGDATTVAKYAEMGGQLLNLGGEFMGVMKVWENSNLDFDRVLGEAYGMLSLHTLFIIRYALSALS